MPRLLIYSHGDVQALQARSSETGVVITIESLESVRKAHESYLLLRQLISRGRWMCPELEALSLVAGLALELHKIKDHLLPQLQEPEPVDLEAILLIKASAIALLALGEEYKQALEHLGGSIDDDLISPRVSELGVLLKHYADQLELDLNQPPPPAFDDPVDWDDIEEWGGPANEFDYDMVIKIQMNKYMLPVAKEQLQIKMAVAKEHMQMAKVQLQMACKQESKEK
ncbi:hypothetical protein EJB05_14824, partial [Eragrostis curvula]